MARMLVVDDNEIFRERLGQALEERGWAVELADGYDAAMAAARRAPPDRAVIDLRMPGRGGLELLEELRALCPRLEAVMLTGYGSIATAVDAMRLGATNYITKPADAEMILAAFERAEAPPLEPPELSYDAPSLARAEWEHIQRVLADCGGNITRAAEALGLHRRTLQRKLQKYAPKD